jgi:uncharacterized protein (TIGR02594 family)
MSLTLPAKYAYVASPDAPETIKQALKMYGTAEVPGNGNNQIILNWAAEVEKATGLPHLGYTDDSIPWCGLFAALVCSRAGYADQIIKTPLWAPSWVAFGDASPIPSFGDVMVFSRNGGGHVSFYVGEDADYYHILGGNQSDMVDIMQEPKSKFTGARRPRWDAGGQPASVRKIIVGASGPAIAPSAAHATSLPPTDRLARRKWIQERVGVAPDGEIGPQTEAAIATFISKHSA